MSKLTDQPLLLQSSHHSHHTTVSNKKSCDNVPWWKAVWVWWHRPQKAEGQYNMGQSQSSLSRHPWKFFLQAHCDADVGESAANRLDGRRTLRHTTCSSPNLHFLACWMLLKKKMHIQAAECSTKCAMQVQPSDRVPILPGLVIRT